MVLLLVPNQNAQYSLIGTVFFNASTSNVPCQYWYWIKVPKCQYRYGHHSCMPVPVMDFAFTGTEPKCRNDSTGTVTIFEWQFR